MRFCAFILVCFLCGCGQSSHESDIKTLDSLKTEVKKISGEFAKIDTTFTLSIKQEVSGKLHQLKQVYMPDSIDIPVVDMINFYQSFIKEDARFKMKHIRIKREIPYTLNQLSDLINDLKNKSLPGKDAEKFIEREKKAAIELLKQFSELKAQLRVTDSTFSDSRMRMNRFIDSLAADSANIQSIRLKLLKARTKRHK